MQIAYNYIVSGRVQGVGFRWYVKNSAVKYNILGTVKNLYDGRVEIYAQGDMSDIYKFKSDIERGPSMSRVDTIIEKECDFNQKFNEFKVVF